MIVDGVVSHMLKEVSVVGVSTNIKLTLGGKALPVNVNRHYL